MLTAEFHILKEGISVGIAHSSGKPWAEYYIVGDRADKIADLICEILNKCEPVRGDKHTLRGYIASKKKKGKK